MKKFYENVIKDEATGCWNWSMACDAYGYGVLRVEGRLMKMHRLSWMLHRGEIPKGVLVCHKCDNRKCANPEHLFLGSYGDNTKDMMRKGRGGVALKLNDEQVAIIRAEPERTLKYFADKFGVSQNLISGVRNGTRRNWGIS